VSWQALLQAHRDSHYLHQLAPLAVIYLVQADCGLARLFLAWRLLRDITGNRVYL
jgi:hypothetical protein